MSRKNKVFIATSLDGYIADKQGGISWLDDIPDLGNDDIGYAAMMASTDALIMGRNSFETVLSFDIDWPYDKAVFVLSNTLKSIPPALADRVFLEKGPLKEVLKRLHKQGFKELYIDGGKTIQNFLREDLIEEMIITTIPVLLGAGIPLFGLLDNPLKFKCVESKIYAAEILQSRFLRKK